MKSSGLWTKIVRILSTELVRNTAIYTSAEVLNKAIPFLLLPILTRYLTPSDYGVVATFTAFVSILAVFVGLGAHGAVTVNFFKLEAVELQKYIAGVLLILLISGAATLVLLMLVKGLIVTRLSITTLWIVVGVLLAACQFITSINLVLWQVEERSAYYVTYQIAQTAFTLILTLILVVQYRLGWFGQLTGITLATVVFAIMSFGFIWKRGYLRFEFSRPYIKDALDFSVPLIPHSLSTWLNTGVDRFLLASMVGMAATGVYAVGYQVGFVIGVLAASVNRAWMPFLFNKLKGIDQAGKIKLVKAIYLYCGGLLALSIGLGVSSPWLAGLFLGKDYSSASRLVIWIAVGYAFDGMYYMVVNQIFFMKRTKFLAAITFMGGILHVLLSYVLIRSNGIVGAGWSTAISFLVSLIMVWFLSAKVFPLPWLFWRQQAVTSA